MSMADSDFAISDTDASARRMSAERWACRGIPTEQLERCIVADMIEVCMELAKLSDRPRDAAADRLGLAMSQARGIMARLEAKP